MASDPTKYFGCELGAQTQIDLKNERYIVNGSHDADKLQEILDGFIEKFVLCPDCENPETVLVRFRCCCGNFLLIFFVFVCVAYRLSRRLLHRSLLLLHFITAL